MAEPRLSVRLYVTAVLYCTSRYCTDLDHVRSSHRDMASGEEPSHRHSPQDSVPRGIRRRAGARRVHDTAQDSAEDLQQDAHVHQKEMEARALAVLLAGRQHPHSLPAPTLQRQRRSRSTSRGSAGHGPQSSRSSSKGSVASVHRAASNSARRQRSFERLPISSLQFLMDKYDAIQVSSSDDQNRSHCSAPLSSQSSLVHRLNRVLQERDAGNSSYSELEGRGSDFLGIQPKEIMVLAALVMFPPVALMAAMAAVLYFS